ncbi:MAG TPA: hypothetical protein VE343_16730, partial [Streptosporangiaceae bacterium]|nr:hypothetical protein [Streptosporangiaceae bacterium]
MYPPGQFSAWNRPSTRAAWLGRAPEGRSAPDEAEPGYSVLALSDPSADATSTQTWAVIDDSAPPDSWQQARQEPGRDRAGVHDDDAPAPGAAAGPAGTGIRRAPREQGGRRMGRLPGPDQPGRRPADHGAVGLDQGPPGRERGPAGRERGSAGREQGRAGPDPGPRASAAGTRVAEPPAGTRVAEPAAGGRTASGSGPAKTGNSGKTGKAAPSRPAADSAPLRTRGRKRGTILLIVVLAVAAAAAGTGGYVLLGRHSPATPQAVTPASAPAAPSSPSGPPGRWKFIRSRATDPRRLTLAELYPKRFTITGNSGTRTIARAGRDCASAVLGSGLQSAVGKSHCNQVLRASYLSTDRKIMATIGVLNLVNATAAEQVGK